MRNLDTQNNIKLNLFMTSFIIYLLNTKKGFVENIILQKI